MTTIHIVSLGCARNEVDSEELAARFSENGFDLVDQEDEAEVVVVNTCGFIEAAKAESIEEIMEAAQLKNTGKVRTVIAAGCMAERYGRELADNLTEADAVIGFDGYDDIAATVREVMAGGHVSTPEPRDRRLLIPVSPVARIDPTKIPPWVPSRRTRLSGAPMAPLKIASGCDRKCAFCAIPSFRGSFQSRLGSDILREAEWLVTQGVRELFLVSENTTSYGKDLTDTHPLESLLTRLDLIDDVGWIRLSYLQPAELKPSLIDAVAETDHVVEYFDLPFQHASAPVLRRMRRFGDAESFLGLLDQIRHRLPTAGIRTNVIVGFPGETEQDVEILKQFLGEAGLDAVGVFPYSDEEGTEGAELDGHLDEDEIFARADDVSTFADTVTSARAEERIGTRVEVLIESVEEGIPVGRARQQGPEDGRTSVLTSDRMLAVGDLVTGHITATEGVDWVINLA